MIIIKFNYFIGIRILQYDTGTRICSKTVQRRLKGVRLHGRRPYVGVPVTVNINV